MPFVAHVLVEGQQVFTPALGRHVPERKYVPVPPVKEHRSLRGTSIAVVGKIAG